RTCPGFFSSAVRGRFDWHNLLTHCSVNGRPGTRRPEWPVDYSCPVEVSPRQHGPCSDQHGRARGHCFRRILSDKNAPTSHSMTTHFDPLRTNLLCCPCCFRSLRPEPAGGRVSD